MREKNPNVLLVDGGDSFTGRTKGHELEAEVIIEGMNHMGYDALNIADGELRFGVEFLEELRQKARFPFLSANILLNEGQSLGEEYLIKEIGGLRVGVLGLVSRDHFDESFLGRTGVIINEPHLHLECVLPKVKEKADVIVLLSHVGLTATENLLEKLDGIDVAIVGHSSQHLKAPKLVGEAIVVQSSTKGRNLGVLELTLDRGGLITAFEGRTVSLSQSTPKDPTVVELIRTFKKKRARMVNAAREQRRREQLMKKNKAFLKMTPEEFIAQMTQEDKLTTPEEFLKKRKEKQD